MATPIKVIHSDVSSQKLEPHRRLSASQMNVATMSLQINVDSANVGGPTQAMASQDHHDFKK